MAIAELRESILFLRKTPLLWISGFVGGFFAALTWMMLYISGVFFTSRLILVFALILLFTTTGMLSLVKDNGGTLSTMFAGGKKYYFRVLLPQLVIIFAIMLVSIVFLITFTLLGQATDIGLLTILTIGIMIPSLILTFFFDTAAVFEDLRVFESIQRSIILVSNQMMEVISFFLISIVISTGVIFSLLIVWEAFLFDKLQPIMEFTDAQREAFTPDQLVSMIGPDGMLITAVIIFFGFLILLPLLFSYKGFFFKKLTRNGGLVIQQQVTGEYDNKGRWYKY
jgi:hypothetical protein